mmetsp:Transcript_37053/g.35775  ORF Transcript_37053/g.35775 Transcript_37053/m.35775 type:complete len:422 (-) Transcript_37053:33-1298(-)|eukprot:CAMPEP_0170545912 /NCGR_PEP_ID=MMETSP0211-20121228/4276_1 /TAXON_ID=311385 /ORGANISM="Pseudokeronopsis sp., Strain OXSARD2" /LENGTH=421 /DNA_ID=CAMNT_0010850071 /DNA_START=111 /DNA_END=1379 /DNA_ORIENTATION=+
MTQTCVNPIGMYIVSIFGPKVTILIGGGICIASTFAASIAGDPATFIFFFGFCYGIGSGFILPTCLFSSWSYLGETAHGFVTGLTLAGVGIGAFISSIFFSYTVNRVNEPSFFAEISPGVYEKYFDYTVAANAMECLRMLGLIFLVIVVFGFFMISAILEEPEKWDQVKEEEDQELKQQLLEEKIKYDYEPDPNRVEELRYDFMEKEAEYFVPTWKLLLSWEFWKCLLICYFQYFYGIYMIISYKQLGMFTISNDVVLMASGGAGLLLNGLFRLAWPNLMDACSFKCVNIPIVILQIVLSLTIPYLASNMYAYFAAVVLSIITEGATTSLLPNLSMKIFGARKGPAVYSFMQFGIGLSAMTSALLVAMLMYIIGTTGMLMIATGFSLIAFLLTVCLNEKPYDYRALYNPKTDAPSDVKERD